METSRKTNSELKRDILDSISRMDGDDFRDVAITFSLEGSTKAEIKKYALADEVIADYILVY